MEKQTVQKSDWNIKPMPAENVSLSVNYTFTPGEMEKIKKGVLPLQMEDKWFIYFENDTLYCHRSWTGFCVYIAEFETGEHGGGITNVIINRNTDQYTEADDQWDCRFLVYLINLLLLGTQTTYPVKGGADPETSSVQQWSHVGKAMFEDDGEDSSYGHPSSAGRRY